MAGTNSEYTRDAETVAREAAREADVDDLQFLVYVVRDQTVDGGSPITTAVIQAIEAARWRLEHVTSTRPPDDPMTAVHTLFFRRPV